MAETMIRKQVYLGRAQDRKLKRLSEQRGRTESELIREAVDQLPDIDDDLARLEAAGLLLPRPVYPDLPKGEAADRLRAELEEMILSDQTDYRLSEAVLEDRQDHA